MANASARAPKQWCLTKNETINSFENWRQNLMYTLSLDKNFVPYLTLKWAKKSKGAPSRDFVDDPNTVDEAVRKTKEQKSAALDLISETQTPSVRRT